jgi:hypothetical protein
MTFTKEQLDAMVRDAEKICTPAGVFRLGDVCCHVKALAAEVERLQAKASISRDNELIGQGDKLYFPWNGKMKSGKVRVIIEIASINVEAAICYVSEEKARLMS